MNLTLPQQPLFGRSIQSEEWVGFTTVFNPIITFDTDKGIIEIAILFYLNVVDIFLNRHFFLSLICHLWFTIQFVMSSDFVIFRNYPHLLIMTVYGFFLSF